ncbi:MAG: protein kinase [Deltaproteobacteria bacterium]|nr:protein kinase [Deltaproteobacteria bacterium]
MRSRRDGVDKLDKVTALRALVRVAGALEHTHGKNRVHRDVKPANILLDGEGRGYLTDFDTILNRDTIRRTAPCTSMGTIGYMAPEAEHNASNVDCRADVYSFGRTVMFCLLRADPPRSVAETEPWTFYKLGVSRDLVNVLRSAVAHDAAKREVTCKEIGEALAHELTRDPAMESDGIHQEILEAEALINAPLLGWRALLLLGVMAVFIIGGLVAFLWTGISGDYNMVTTFSTRIECDWQMDRALCYRLGYSYEQGKNGLPQDKANARAYYQRACELDSAAACENLARMLEQGEGGPADVISAQSLFQKSCDLAAGLACYDAGWGHYHGVGVTQGFQQAAECYRRGCDAGIGEACYELGAMYADGLGVVKSSLVEAFTYYQRACERKYVDGCFQKAYAYAEGRGVSEDDEAAIEPYTMACEGGVSDACYRLGLHLREGWGVAVDIDLAVERFRQACVDNHEEACMALDYLVQGGVAKGDFEEIRSLAVLTYWYKRCEMLNGGACVYLAWRQGRANNRGEALRLAQMACGVGEPQGCYYVGAYHESGFGVERNEEIARAYYEKACSGSVDRACKALMALNLPSP